MVAERPRLQPYIGAMTVRIAQILQLDESCISIKGKTNEGMGWIGRGEGIAVMAVASIAGSALPGPGGTA